MEFNQRQSKKFDFIQHLSVMKCNEFATKWQLTSLFACTEHMHVINYISIPYIWLLPLMLVVIGVLWWANPGDCNFISYPSCCWNRNVHQELGQWYGGCPGRLRHHDITSHDIDCLRCISRYPDSKVHATNIARFMRPTWDHLGPMGPGGPMLAAWTLLSGYISQTSPFRVNV